MEVRYDSGQDLTLILSEEEERVLTERQTKEFHEESLRGLSRVLGACIFLAYSADNSGNFKNSKDLDGRMGRIVIPEPGTQDAWRINLSEEGIRYLRNGWNYGIRYNGSSKLFIRVKEF